MGIVFVAGVHAVGKTTACNYAASSLGIAHYSASNLIKQEKASAISQSGKVVVDVEGNQKLLIRGTRKVCEQHRGLIILDGHFTLLRPDGGIEAIPIEIYRQLFLEGIVVYHDKPEAIAKRLSNRDKSSIDPTDVERQQNFEFEQAHLVATELGVPIKPLEAFDESGLVQIVLEWMAS